MDGGKDRHTCQTSPNNCTSCLRVTDFSDEEEIWAMAQRQFNQAIISHANRFIELQLQHLFLLNFYGIFNRHDLLPRKFFLGQGMHQCCLPRSDWTRK